MTSTFLPSFKAHRLRPFAAPRPVNGRSRPEGEQQAHRYAGIARWWAFLAFVAAIGAGLLLALPAAPARAALTANDVSLILAIDSGDDLQAETLLRAGASANAYEATWPNRSALMLAAWFDRPKIVRMLLAQGAEVNAADQLGETPLMWAIQDPLGDLACIRMILDHGANVNAADKRGRTPLMFAVAGQEIHAVMGNSGQIGRTVPMRFVPNAKVVRLLLAHKADVNVSDDSGETALMQAASTGDLAIVKLLIEAGARPGLTDRAGHTASWYAEQAGHKSIAAYLAKMSVK